MRSRTMFFRFVSLAVLAMAMANGSAQANAVPGTPDREPASALRNVAIDPDADRIRLAQAETQAQGAEEATPRSYEWSAVKSPEGVALSGYVPAEATRRFFGVRAGGVPTEDLAVAEGAPENFIANALAGLDALNVLETGRVAYTGTRWILGGTAATEERREAILETFAATVDPAGWMIALSVAATGESGEASEPEPEPEPETDSGSQPESGQATKEAGTSSADESAEQDGEAVDSEFTWSVSKSQEGGLVVTGLVPTPQMQSYLDQRDGGGIDNRTEVGSAEAPENFFRIALAALDVASGLDGGRIAYDGTQWSVAGTVASQAEIEALTGTIGAATDMSDWSISLEVASTAPQQPDAPEPSGETETADTEAQPVDESAPAADPDYGFAALKTGEGPIELQGDVPATSFVNYADVIAGGVAAENVTVSSPAPEGFVASATAGLRGLALLAEGRLEMGEGQWSLAGRAARQAAADTARAHIADLPDADAWSLEIGTLPPAELCIRAVASFSDTHTILFAPASARLTDESADALNDLVSDLRGCPEARLNIEGHTDSDGAEDANMALSVARAEAVVSELIDLGLDATRLYAIGYGETLPVADNDSPAGKARNRRIVFELVEED